MLMINYFVPNKLIFSNGHNNILALLEALFVALPLAKTHFLSTSSFAFTIGVGRFVGMMIWK